MSYSWKDWCRLCACEKASLKVVVDDKILEIVQKFVNLTFVPENICQNCLHFLQTIQRFSDRCSRVDKMFSELVMLDSLGDDFSSLKFRYGVEDEMKLVDFDNLNFHQSISKVPSVDQCIDTADLNVEIKEELSDPDNIFPKEKAKRKKSKKSLDDSQNDSQDSQACNESNNTEKDFESLLDDDGDAFDDPDFELKDETDDQLQNKSDADISDDKDKDDVGDVKFDFDCHMCPTKFDAFHGLLTHCRNEHDCVPQVKCICGKMLSSRATLTWHKKLHSQKKDDLYKCRICEKIYNRRQSYLTHMRTVHNEKEKGIFVCSKCPKRFSSEKKVKIHEQVHLPDELKMIHPCPYCDKKFTKTVNVQAHIKAIHIGDRPFICEECGKSFGTKGALKEHQITHSEDRPFQCSYCPKKFKNLPRLKTHEDIHNDTQYICPHCGLQLNTKRTLKMHMVVHSDAKKFKCYYCGNEFKRSKALKNHLILHTGLRPYSCPFCEKTFANGSNCRSHKKKAHPVELAALEASGEQPKVTNIPKLEHLQPKAHQLQMQMQNMFAMDGSNSSLQPSVMPVPTTNGDIQNHLTQTLPSLHIHSHHVPHSNQTQQIVQTSLPDPQLQAIMQLPVVRMTDTPSIHSEHSLQPQ